MKTNKEKFNALVSKEKTNTLDRNRMRIKNRARLRESQNIALKVLDKLEEPGWSQKRLAEELNVSPQRVNKIVKGKENLTLETQVELQKVLGIPILASYYEEKIEKISLEDFFSTDLAFNKPNQNEGYSFYSNSFESDYKKVAEETETYLATA